MSIRWLGSALLGLALFGCDDASDAGAPADPPAFRAHARVGSRGNFLGVYQPQTASWTLRMQRPGWNEPASEQTFVFGAPGDTPVVGDWDGDGEQTPGAWRAGTWSLRNVLATGDPAVRFRFGPDDGTPVVGDWDGDGVASVGVFKDGVFSLRNVNAEGDAELTVMLGAPGDVPVAGDWDGDGTDTVGVYEPASGDFVLLDAEEKQTRVALGVPNAQPVVGDWDDNRRDTVGIRQGVSWTLLNDHRVWERRDKAVVDYLDAEVHGLGEIAVAFGDDGSVALTGNWLPTANRGFPDAGTELREFFPLAADYQNPDSFESWLDAGVNTVIRVRSKTDPDAASPLEVEAWTAKANELGLKMIREPRANPADDNDEPNLLAYVLFDEPDYPRPNGPNDPYDTIAGLAASVRAEGVRPRPIFVNFAGWSILRQNDPFLRHGPGDRNPADFYSRYLELEDWASQDIYALSQMYANENMNVDDAIATLPLTFAKLRRWAPTKPQFAYIETTQHHGDSRELAPEEFRAQVWLAIVAGVRGVFYFAADDCRGACVTPDGTKVAVKGEMRVQNARIKALTHVLQGEIDPLAFSVSAAAPLETGWRASEDGNYIFAVNNSTSAVQLWLRIEGKLVSGAIEVLDDDGRTVTRTIDTVDGYAFRDSFAPYDARVYRFR